MIGELIEIFGKENVSSGKKDIMAYSYDASQVEGNLIAVVWPSSTKQVSDLMRYCSENQVRVFPRGAGTNLSGGAIPNKGVVVDFSRMNRILDVSLKDVLVEPGVVIEDLELKLNENEKTLPFTPASDKACTVGGCIAEDSAGIRAMKYGVMGDWVLELEVVLPDGTLLKTSGKDFIGSEGILGLITKARLKIADKPRTTSLTIFDVDSFQVVQDIALNHMKPNVSAIEFISQRAN